MTQNPLAHLYRSKTFYVSLPSKNNFYHSGISTSIDGEIGIMPMTAADEIKIKNPDALFNGQGLIELISSCVPDIKNPREIPISDLDTLIIGIRIASSGATMPTTVKCPECDNEAEYEIDLTSIIATAQPIEPDTLVKLDNGAIVTVHPMTLEEHSKVQMETFYQLRMQYTIENEELSVEKRTEIFNDALVSAIALQVEQVASCIKCVEFTDKDGNSAIVDNRDHIVEWTKNMDKDTHKIISDRISKLADSKMNSKINLKCGECGHEFTQEVELNPVNFF